MNAKQFCKEYHIRATSEMVDENPNMPNWDANHYKVVLRRAGKQFTLYFSMGKAICKEPTAADVIECLVSDSQSAMSSFEEWCDDLGYDTDSRKAERTYTICVRQASKLRNFLGNTLYQEALMLED